MKVKALKTKKHEDILKLLKELKLGERVKEEKKVIIKPNLTLSKKPPTTTDVKFAEILVKYLQEASSAKIIVAEGSGGNPTSECFEKLGWKKLERDYGIELVDLNEEEVEIVENSNCFVLKSFPLPKVLKTGFLISLAVLKHHTEAGVTLCLKNMMGIAPGRFFSGTRWSKAKFHTLGLSKCIVDVNLHRRIDFCIVDGIVGQIGGEIYGTPKRFNTLIAGYDPVAVDSIGAKILGKNPREIEHLVLAEEKKLGKILD